MALMFASAKSLFEAESLIKKITTSSNQLDELLDGGIPTGQITEIFGLNGVGKTNLCLQLAVNVQIPSLYSDTLVSESECIYIDTEMTFVMDRLKEIAKANVQAIHTSAKGTQATQKKTQQISSYSVQSILNGIHLYECDELDQLIPLVRDLSNYIKEHEKVKLLIIDSLTFTCFSQEESFKRTRKLYIFASLLRRLIYKYGIAVVLTNNMTTRVGKETSWEIPCLGESWSYIPNVKIELKNVNQLRRAKLHKCSGREIPEREAPFSITDEGIRD